MKFYKNSLEFELNANTDIKDITYEIEREVEKSGIKDGIASIFILGSTGSITTIEYERGVINDLKKAINRIAPPDIQYEHNFAWHDGNGHSHVQAALLGPSLTIPVRNGKLTLGTWQQIVIINHDIRKRIRKVEITIIGS